jgi:hypothetical protein
MKFFKNLLRFRKKLNFFVKFFEHINFELLKIFLNIYKITKTKIISLQNIKKKDIYNCRKN